MVVLVYSGFRVLFLLVYLEFIGIRGKKGIIIRGLVFKE